MPFDLSEVLFITTANVLDFIPAPLLDRMEIIQIPGYLDSEKIEIAKRHLIPRAAREHGLNESDITFDDAAILKMIREYSRRAGGPQRSGRTQTAFRKRRRR